MRAPLALLLFAVACLGAGCRDADDNRPARWSYISPAIIQPGCATMNCHSQAAARAGVVLDSPDTAYENLVLVPDAGPVSNFVVPGRPDQSELMFLLMGVGSRRMPPDFVLPNDDIALIERWILRGAPHD